MTVAIDANLNAGVRDLGSRLCDASLMADADRYAACYTSTARWVLEEHVAKRHGRPAVIQGNDAIRERFIARRGEFLMYIAEVLSTIVEPVDDDGVVAKAWSVIRGTSWYTDRPPHTAIARYADLIAIEDGAYRYAERALVTYYHGAVDLADRDGLTPPSSPR